MFAIARHSGTEFEQHLLPARRKWVQPGEGWHYSSMKMAQRAYSKVIKRYPPYENIVTIVEVKSTVD